MIVIPAIDLKEGKCVRLEQGLMERDTIFCDNPAEQAREWVRQGGELLHMVDLDGAFAGVPKNKAAISAIVDSISIPTQLEEVSETSPPLKRISPSASAGSSSARPRRGTRNWSLRDAASFPAG